MPLLATALPPITDYPNHLARMLFLGTRTADPVMTAMLAPNWAMLPNLGVDAILPWVLRWVPVELAGRAMLAGLLVLSVMGVAALSRATFGGRSFWALGGALVACNGAFLMGFLNFLLGAGLAMLAAAGWFRFRESRPRISVAAAVVVACVLFFCHLVGVWFFLLLIGACEAERCWTARVSGLWRPMLSRGALLALVAAGPAALYAMTDLQATAGPVLWSSVHMKAYFGIFPVVNYLPWLDWATAGAILAVLALGVATGRAVVPVRWRIVIAVLAALFALTPVTMKGLSYVDARFAVLLGFAVFAGVRAVRVPRGLALALCAGGAALLGARTGLVAVLWHRWDAEVQDVRRVIGPIEAGAFVLPVWVGPEGALAGPTPRMLSDGAVMDFHLSALVMIERRAFWPYLFADPGQQPLRLVGAAAAAVGAIRAGAPMRVGRAEGAGSLVLPPWQDWFRRFEYVLVVDPSGSVPGLTESTVVGGGPGYRLDLVKHSGMASLYRMIPEQE